MFASNMAADCASDMDYSEHVNGFKNHLLGKLPEMLVSSTLQRLTPLYSALRLDEAAEHCLPEQLGAAIQQLKEFPAKIRAEVETVIAETADDYIQVQRLSSSATSSSNGKDRLSGEFSSSGLLSPDGPHMSWTEVSPSAPNGQSRKRARSLTANEDFNSRSGSPHSVSYQMDDQTSSGGGYSYGITSAATSAEHLPLPAPVMLGLETSQQSLRDLSVPPAIAIYQPAEDIFDEMSTSGSDDDSPVLPRSRYTASMEDLHAARFGLQGPSGTALASAVITGAAPVTPPVFQPTVDPWTPEELRSQPSV